MTEIKSASELDALPVGSVVLDRKGVAYQKASDRYADGHAAWDDTRGGVARASQLVGNNPDGLTVLHVPGRDLLAEAEARGYERGKRDALTEAAADLPWTYRQQSGLPDHAERLARWLRARAGETPGGAA